MNRQGKGPNLTWIFIGIAFAVVVLTLAMTSMDTFLADNNVSSSDTFNNIYGGIYQIRS